MKKIILSLVLTAIPTLVFAQDTTTDDGKAKWLNDTGSVEVHCLLSRTYDVFEPSDEPIEWRSFTYKYLVDFDNEKIIRIHETHKEVWRIDLVTKEWVVAFIYKKQEGDASYNTNRTMKDMFLNRNDGTIYLLENETGGHTKRLDIEKQQGQCFRPF